jgi:hypothetical protein
MLPKFLASLDIIPAHRSVPASAKSNPSGSDATASCRAIIYCANPPSRVTPVNLFLQTGDEIAFSTACADEAVASVPARPDSVPLLPLRYPFSHFIHFVARHPGILQPGPCPILHQHVAMTNAAGMDLDSQLSSAGCGISRSTSSNSPFALDTCATRFLAIFLLRSFGFAPSHLAQTRYWMRVSRVSPLFRPKMNEMLKSPPAGSVAPI